jgi:hypothetical protein
MSREMYGISALDPRVAATDKFIQDKQIPPDKVEDFLLSMGADPKLASLVFKYRRVQEAAKQQQAQPPTASVDQEVSSQYAQLKQRERMGQGVAGMPAPNLARAPMQGGITGQPMPQMAGGGIVAFAKGGRSPRTYTVDPEGNVDIGSAGDLIPYEKPAKPPRSAAARAAVSRGIGALARFPLNHPLLTAGLLGGAYLLSPDDEEPKAKGATVEEAPSGTEFTPEEIAILARDQAAQKEDTQVATPTKINLPAAPTFKRPDLTPFTEAIAEAKKRVPKDREAALAEEMAREEQLGETKVIEARGKELKAQREKAVTSPEKKFWLAFAQAGFAASAKGARNLWETLSIGGVEGMKAYEAMKDKEAATLEKIADKELQLTSMSAAIKRGAMERGDKRFDDARREYQTLQLQHAAQMASIATAENAFGANIYGTQVQSANTQAQIAAADRRAAGTNAGDLDKQIARAVAKANDFRLPAQERATYQKLVDRLVRQRAEIEATESGVISKKLGLDAEAAMMGGMSDGFGNDVQRLN